MKSPTHALSKFLEPFAIVEKAKNDADADRKLKRYHARNNAKLAAR